MGKRIGFVGIVVEDRSRSAQVQEILTAFGSLITGRIGVPDRARGIAVICVIVMGTNEEVGALTGRLGNLPGVSVRSALTAKEWEEEGEES